MLPKLTREIEDALDAVLDELPSMMPHVEDVTEVEPGIPGYAWANEHGHLHVGVRPCGGLVFDWDVPGHGADRAEAAPGDGREALHAFVAAADVYAEASHDPWDDDSEYGYEDYRVVGDDAWEDQKGMAALKLRLKIPDDWFLVKVVNFHDACPTSGARRSLATIEAWLADNCEQPYRRVGWSSGCSTKVGVAFASQNEAFFFYMRWR